MINMEPSTGTLIGLWFNTCVALPATIAFAGAVTIAAAPIILATLPMMAIAAAIAPQDYGRIVD